MSLGAARLLATGKKCSASLALRCRGALSDKRHFSNSPAESSSAESDEALKRKMGLRRSRLPDCVDESTGEVDVNVRLRHYLNYVSIRYLSKFSPSENGFRRYLERKARGIEFNQQIGAFSQSQNSEVQNVIKEIVCYSKVSGFLDDDKFAEKRVRILVSRGKSSRSIVQDLVGRGVSTECAKVALKTVLHSERCHDEDLNRINDRAAAQVIIKKWQRAPKFQGLTTSEFKQKMLQKLFAAGIPYELSQEVLSKHSQNFESDD